MEEIMIPRFIREMFLDRWFTSAEAKSKALIVTCRVTATKERTYNSTGYMSRYGKASLFLVSTPNEKRHLIRELALEIAVGKKA
jgi:hypothetical protein